MATSTIPIVAIKPFTLFVNKATIAGEQHAAMTWGPAQAGVAKGVADAVAEGIIDSHMVDALLLIAAVWVDPLASDMQQVYDNNVRATCGALQAGRQGLPRIETLLAARSAPFNAFFRARE